jgi:osmoprotectant transport system substrate-binding protein
VASAAASSTDGGVVVPHRSEVSGRRYGRSSLDPIPNKENNQTMRTTRTRAMLALLVALGMLAAACGDDTDTDTGAGNGNGNGNGTDGTSDPVDGPTIRLAPQDFAESRTLTEAYGQFLEARGFDVEIQAPNGFRDQVYPGLEEDRIDLIIDYTGSAASFLDPDGTPSADEDETYERLVATAEGAGLAVLDYSPADDKNALVVLRSFAEENDLTTISDLKAIESEVTLGGSAQCAERLDCLLGYEDPDIYGLDFAGFTTLEYGPPLAAALEANVVQAAQYQTTAPEIASGNFVVLEDDQGMLSADNIVPVLRTEILDAYGDELRDAINELSALLTTETLIDWNEATDIENEEPRDVARAWLEDNDLI